MTAIDAMVATATLLEVAEPEEMEAERNVSFEGTDLSFSSFER